MAGDGVSNKVKRLRARAGRLTRARVAVSLRRFRKDARGIAAVEFGFIAPILLLMLLGTVELTRAISIDRRFSLVTSTVADLVTREEALTATDVNAIYDVAAQIMRPYEVTPLKLSIVPVKSKSGTIIVYPPTTNRPAYNQGTVPARCAAYPLTNGMLAANESLIVVEGVYRFKLLFASFLGPIFSIPTQGVDWSEKSFARPRKSGFVDFGDKMGTC